MPSAKAVEFERVATKLGFVRIRQTGAHGHWAHPDGRRVIIPTHGNQEIGPPLFFKIVKQLGIGIEQFKQLKLTSAIFGSFGVRRFRPGIFQHVLKPTAKSGKGNAKAFGSGKSLPVVGFIAMAQFRFGQTDDARSRLAQRREVIHDSRWANNGQSQAFLREVVIQRAKLGASSTDSPNAANGWMMQPFQGWDLFSD